MQTRMAHGHREFLQWQRKPHTTCLSELDFERGRCNLGYLGAWHILIGKMFRHTPCFLLAGYYNFNAVIQGREMAIGNLLKTLTSLNAAQTGTRHDDLSQDKKVSS